MKVLFTILIILMIIFPVYAWSDERIVLCDEDITDPAHPYYWQRLQQKVKGNLGPGDQREAYFLLREMYVSGLAEEDMKQEDVAKFIHLLDRISAGMMVGNVVIKPAIDDYILFAGSDRYMVINCEAPLPQYLKEIAFMVIALKKVHDASWSVLLGATTTRIKVLSQQYQDWFANGLAMWPWESYFNGLMLDEKDVTAPKRWQLVVGRPSLGFGFNSDDSINKSDLEATFAVEPIGFVSYTSDDYSDYWGVSLLLTAGDGAGIGYGLLGRYQRYLIGFTRREDDPTLGISTDDSYIFLGYDLYELVSEKRDRYAGFKKKVRSNIARYRSVLGVE